MLVADTQTVTDGAPSAAANTRPDVSAAPSLAVMDAQFRFALVTPGFAQLAGRQPGGMVGQDAVLLCAHGDLDALMARRMRLLELPFGASTIESVELLRPDGTCRRCTLRTHKLALASGAPTYLVVVAEAADPQPEPADAASAGPADRHDAVEPIAHWRSMFEAGGIASAWFVDGQLRCANREFEQLFGWRAQELASAAPSALVGGLRAWRTLLVDASLAMRDGGGWSAEMPLFRRSGARCVCDIRVRWIDPDRPALGTVVTAYDLSALRQSAQQRLHEITSQRDLLIREVHHRIKNNLQGVAGLLYQTGHRKPQLAETLNGVANQISSIAQVYGLQVRDAQDVAVVDVLGAVLRNLSRTTGVPFRLSSVAPPPGARWVLGEQDAVPVALVINELATNAMKHRTGAEPIDVAFTADASGVVLQMANAGQLPIGFDLESVATSVSGLGLVKAMLPRRGARLALEQEGRRVLARLNLGAPAITARPA